jgi:SAM-dependent methyltransferase
MSEEYWKAKNAADEFEKYWNVQNKASLEQRWGLVERLAKKSPSTLLDVGCGIGNLIAFTSLATTENYLGIDISPPMVERARTLHPGYHFEVADPMKFNNVSDLVVAHGFLLHQYDLFLKLYKLVQFTGFNSQLIFDVLVAKNGYSRRSSEGYWMRVISEEEYAFMRNDLEKLFTSWREVKFGEWSGQREYYISCRRFDAPYARGS